MPPAVASCAEPEGGGSGQDQRAKNDEFVTHIVKSYGWKGVGTSPCYFFAGVLFFQHHSVRAPRLSMHVGVIIDA